MSSGKALENRCKKLPAMQAQIAQPEAEGVRTELKAEMKQRGEYELNIGAFVLRWKVIVTKKFDGQALKAAIPALYEQLCKISSCWRFTLTWAAPAEIWISS